MKISTTNKVITNIANQLLLHSMGAKKPKMYSIPPTIANKLIRDSLSASFKCEDETIQRTMPLSRITTLFKYTLVDL